MPRNIVSVLFGFVLSAITGPAIAGNEPTFDMAEAERKLEKARTAHKEFKIALACQLYEESLEIAPDKTSTFAMNVEYDLIECWVLLGHYRDAYLQAVDLAKRVPDKESSDGLKKRVLEIKQEAPCIKLDVPDHLHKIVDFKAFIDGIEVPPAYWAPAYCWPLNVGEHEITVTAPGKMWKARSIKTPVSRRQYVVTLANPEPLPPPPPPLKQRSPINGKYAIGVGSGLLVLGGVLWVAGVVAENLSQGERSNVNVAAAAFGGLGSGIFATGLGIYVATSPPSPKTHDEYEFVVPMPSQKGRDYAAMNLGVGIVGRF